MAPSRFPPLPTPELVARLVAAARQCMTDWLQAMAVGVTVPSLRGRGCQTALLEQRIADVTHAGCDLLVSQCLPGSTSQNYQLRVGFQIAGSQAWWVRGPQRFGDCGPLGVCSSVGVRFFNPAAQSYGVRDHTGR